MKGPIATPLAAATRNAALAAALLAAAAACAAAQDAGPAPVDEQRVKAAGIRRVEGRHLTLYTDVPRDNEVDGLPAVFDLAYPQWCRYFELAGQAQRPWRMNAFLMQDKARFERAGVYPADLPPFLHGFAKDADLWFYEQPTAYYRRHLLLHEGTHGFMNTLLGGCGAPWYMEGVAELLATHRLAEGRLELGYFPRDRLETPGLGRIKLVQDAVAAQRPLAIAEIMALTNSYQRPNEPYAWCWALCALLDGQPRYRQRFRELRREVRQPEFNRRFLARFSQAPASDWDQLLDDWQVFCAGIEPGYDLVRAAIEFAPGVPLAAGGASVHVAADRGWQSSRVRLEAGRSYRLRASGRFQLVQQPRAWWSEAGGVSIRYHAGQPLGILLAAVRPDAPTAAEPSAFLRPATIGLGAALEPKVSGTLYLKLNDSPAELADNTGGIEVSIQRE